MEIRIELSAGHNRLNIDLYVDGQRVIVHTLPCVFSDLWWYVREHEPLRFIVDELGSTMKPWKNEDELKERT